MSNKAEYETIHIYPVNYSVASNEDIFQLIKVDILYKLLAFGDKIEISNEAISKDIKLGFYIQSHAQEIVRGFYSLYLLNKDAPEIDFDVFLGLYKKFEKWSSKSKEKDKTDKQLIEDLFGEAEKGNGLIYEQNIWTLLIYKYIDQLKKSGKKIVLIIDDLDRVDPEHIFRILNIFAAHFDTYSSNENPLNKFRFDKVVLVCDIQNIRNIFHAKYGSETDFSGYIDKFYSTEIFKFYNREIIVEKQKNFF